MNVTGTTFNTPVGIDYHEPTDSVVMSVNYPGGGSGLFHLSWNGSTFDVEQLTLTGDITFLSQWEHVTFANAGILDIPDVSVPETSRVLAGMSLGAVIAAARFRRGRRLSPAA